MVSKKSEETTDLFQFANQLLPVKEDLFTELFFFSKNYVPYQVKISKEVGMTMDTLMIDGVLEALFEGSETGMQVRDIGYDTSYKNVIGREDLKNVFNANEVIDWIENRREQIEFFSADEHDFKFMRGIVARITHPTDKKQKFFIVKAFQSTKLVTRPTGLQMSGDQIESLKVDAAFTMPRDNQVMIINGDIFIFNQSKFEKVFNYDFAKLQKADKKAIEFNKKFRISVPSGLTGVENFFRENKSVLNKFIKTDFDLIDQEKILDVSEEMGLELMTDDAGAIILMENKDFNVMLDIINDNYYESAATGMHYVARTKKVIQDSRE